ncbi:MAG: redox-regulated ATPase YchF [Thermoproteota archaeon]|jgi:ribosome-binding ATPase YchF (GTP1/OBG family)|nr:redox-regulated ATPase YchF [Thermoproteota archaeon]
MPLIGIIGKPNVGKSTFFSAITKLNVKIAPFPFTTIEPNKGIGYVRVKCVCKELGVQDNPRNSICINGTRYVPIEIIDVAGLVPEAWKGKGLGNKFLDELRRSDALIHVVDTSGSTDFEGRIVKPGTHDPLEDIKFIEEEITMWVFSHLKEDFEKEMRKLIYEESSKIVDFLERKLSGFSIKRKHIMRTVQKMNKNPKEWKEDDLKLFVSLLIKEAKPILIAANKIDLPSSWINYERIKNEMKDRIVIPVSAEAELALRKAADLGIIDYMPGNSDFKILKNIDEKRLAVLNYIRENVLKKFGSTGVQEALEVCYFKLLNYIAVFPVEDQNRLTDHQGNVLPDVFLVPSDTTARELAYMIHTDLGKNFIYAIDVKNKQRIGAEYVLKHRDVIKIVAAK